MMGIFDFVRQGVQEMLVQRPDAQKQLIVFKHPDRTIPNMAQLTVDADECAVFFRDGSHVGVLRTAGAGQRHTLSAQNIPFLGQFIDKFTGGNVFVTDLYFVTMRPIFDTRFGGELGYMEDPMLGEMVTPRIYGSFAFQIVDPVAFIVGYSGMQGQQSNESLTRWITGKFMNSAKTVVGELCVAEQKSLLQLMPLQNQIAQVFLSRCPDLSAIGVKLVDVGQFNINLNDADEATLKEAQSEIGKAKRKAKIAGIGIAQAEAEAAQKQFQLDQQFQQDARYVQGLAGGDFSRFAAGKALMGAGEGMAKGGGGGAGSPAMVGAGLGMGMGMAQSMMQGMQPQVAPPPQAQAPSAGGMVTCGDCSASVPQGRFCAECGTSLAPPVARFCSACGAQGVPGAKFCQGCGTGFPA
jgi:membrane protease subunit (stomatin/prohibitin family)